MASGKPKPPVPPKPTAFLSEGGNRRPVITVSPLTETAGQNHANGVVAGDTADESSTKELVHEVTVIIEHRAEAEALCNGSNDAMPTTDDKVDPTPSTSTQAVQNGESEAHSRDVQQQRQPLDSSKRNTITEDWSIKESVESGDEACCTRLSHLIHRKAKELSTHLTKPPKPQKPVKDGKGAPPQPKSFGDEIPGGRHGIRYADEDTEASSDYQDVDLSKLAVAEITTVAVHKEGTPKPVIEENEYEIVEAPREEVKPTPLPIAPIMVIVEEETTMRSGDSVPEPTKNKMQSLEKPKRPPPPKPEATKKPRVRFGVEVFPTDIIAAIAAKKKGGTGAHETSMAQSTATETGAAAEKEKSSDKQAQETPLEKPVLVRVMEREEPSPVLSTKMPKSMFPQSSPIKKTKPQRPPPPKIPSTVLSIHPPCSPPPPPSSPPHSQEVPAMPLTAEPAHSVTPESTCFAVTDMKTSDTVEDVLAGDVVVSQERDKAIPAEVPPCAPISQEPVRESKVASITSKVTVDASKPKEAPCKKRTPPPRPPPPKCKWKPSEAPPATTKRAVSQKPTVSPKPSFSQKPAAPRRSASPAVLKQEVLSGMNVYSQTDDLVEFRAKNIVADLDALLAQKEAEEVARGKNVSCIEASIKTMAREATHQFKSPDVMTPGNFDSQTEREVPQAPPRKRRQRSRTVEAVRVSGEEQARRLRRSHSLSEADVRIKTAQRLGRDDGSDVAATITETFVMVLESPITKKELKDLYTNVTVAPSKERRFKEVPKPTPTTGMRFRPLPAPPPPPRGKLKSPASAAAPSSVDDSPLAPAEAAPTPSESFDTLLSQAPVGEPSESQVEPETVELRMSPAKQHDSKTISKSDSFSRQSTRSGSTSPKVRWENSEPKTFRLSNSTFYGPPLEIPPEAQRGAESPSTEPNASSEKSRSSWYDDSDASGDIADVDSPAVPSDTDPAVSSRKSDSSPGSVQRSKTRLKEKKRASAKFYCDVDAERESSTDGDVPRVSSRGSGSDKMLEAVETKGEDTDELLEMAEGLQKEMTQVLVERQKRLLESFDSELSAQRAESESREQRSAEENESPSLMPRKDLPSVHSSASEVSWQGSSEEESDGEETRNMSLDEAARHRRKRKRMYIARELASSEQAFVDALHLLNKDFREAVRAASEERGSPIVPDDVLDQILKHLPHLVDLSEELLGQLQDRVDNWEGREQVADVLIKMGPFLKLYSSYIKDFEAMTAALEEAKRKYPEFQRVVCSFEQSTRCRQLTLQQYMLKPIQRIPQYKLLLTDYVKNLEVDTPEYRDACSALEIVSQVAQHANESMRLGDNFCKLMSLQNRISNRYEVLRPGRTFLKEGELMKLSRKEMQPRYFVLFSDSLLYLLPIPQGFYRVNYELPLSGMKVTVSPQQYYQNEFSVYTTKRSFTLSASSPEEHEGWISALTKAIDDNIHRKSSFHVLKKEGLQASVTSELGREAPVWIPDQRVTMCQLCTSGFTFTHRRHHCRACGKVVCAACSSQRLPLPYLGDKPARTCDDCFHSLQIGELREHPEAEGEGDLGQAKKKKTARGILQEVAANDLGSSMSGYLQQWWKKAWKRQWFVIKEHVLYVYRASEDVAALRTVPLLGFQVGAVKKGFEEMPREQLFRLEHTGLDPLIFCADTPDLAARWQEAMEEATKLS